MRSMIVSRRLAKLLLAATLSPCLSQPSAAETAYVSNQTGGISRVDVDTGAVADALATGKDPRGLALTPDRHWLLTANQDDSDVAVIDLTSGQAVARIAVGRNVEFLRIAPDGQRAYVTYEPSSQGRPGAAPAAGDAGASQQSEAGGKPIGSAAHKAAQAEDDAPEPAAVAVIDLKQRKVIARMPASLETEGMDFSPDGKLLVVANEGDDTLVAYDLAALKPLRKVDLSAFGHRPRGVRAQPAGGYVITMENSDNLVLVDDQLKPVRAVASGKGPYGIAYQPGSAGKRLWVAAARSDAMQLFDGTTLAPLGEVKVGKRCWHFSFNQDGSKLLAACGRSNALYLVDTASLSVIKVLEGFKVPWGVVTDGNGGGSLASSGP